MIYIPLSNRESMKLFDMALIPEFDSKLIFLGQLRKINIIFHNNFSHMAFTRDGKIIV